ncbi:uncharacterized protein A1O9_05438 [Exophiala aquamarina CBS 119918]|uniref:Uncharacterized protein n=1 Tax=Exophiala aquamarina CBS 119918 TaxID=1182545 RepID=A0A072PCD7_9EURO|nr:uncharacterized protein A1O9_05438 [Exophiala aquamarina CBS 119918]KEF57521.1 hypothetical protein A1O9_05438 [Exophiala aquamarina CBS 119918]
MAPSSSHLLLPRQFGPGSDGFDDRDNGDGISRTAIGGIAIGVVVVIVVIACIMAVRIMRRRKARRRTGGVSVPLHNRPGASSGPNLIPSPYSNKPAGYQNTQDQNQSLLGNAAVPGGVAWDADHVGVGSTQDGFGFTTSNITRPASIANVDAPPPRYEEAAASGPAVPPAGGEAASYYNAPRGEPERGRSATRESDSRARALSVDNRSMNGTRSRSVSRFREEHLDNVNLHPNLKS